VYVIILKAKEWLTQNEQPSKYRAKSISRLIRIVTSLMKEAAANEVAAVNSATQSAADSVKSAISSVSNINLSNSIKGLIDTLKSVDTAIAAITLAYAIYDHNRKVLQDESNNALEESILPISCKVSLQRPSDDPRSESIRNSLFGNPFDLSTNLSLDNFNNNDLSSFSCPISLDNSPSPSEPIEDKISNFSCPIDQDTPPHKSTQLSPH